MPILIAVVFGAVAFAILEARHGAISSGIAGRSPLNAAPLVIPPHEQPPQVMIGSTAVDAAGLGLGVQALDKGLSKALPNLASSIPLIGGAIAAIGGALLAGHVQRAKEATDENSAMAAGVKDVDAHIAAAFNNLNAGRISPDQAAGILNDAWANYWDIVSRHIQPGRNGCQNGALIPAYTGGPTYHDGAYYGCGGTKKDWGAACCVGSVVKASLANCLWALQHPGQSAPVFKLYPDKYGFGGRDGYRVVYQS